MGRVALVEFQQLLNHGGLLVQARLRRKLERLARGGDGGLELAGLRVGRRQGVQTERMLPSGEQATLLIWAGWSLKSSRLRPVSMSHRRTVLSMLPDARTRPSGEADRLSTWPTWPLYSAKQSTECVVLNCHACQFLSYLNTNRIGRTFGAEQSLALRTRFFLEQSAASVRRCCSRLWFPRPLAIVDTRGQVGPCRRVALRIG